MTRSFLVTLLILVSLHPSRAEPISLSGIYPHLAVYNDESECGIGAVVPWADRLWAITYAPHKPKGSTDKLYEITRDLELAIRPESIGGTPANRMIHRESQQLFIGPYAIDAERKVRAIPYTEMFGRPTGNARHLTDPAGKIYYATMEEGLYEVDVQSLAVTRLWSDEAVREGRHADLPGYHGKGLYSGHGRLIYANNGEHGQAAKTDPTTPSGVLASWDGQADAWNVIRRNQFTEVTGPGGIHGSDHPATDPVWSVGWDHRSLILALLDDGKWSWFRLPKGSHSYDGAHGWNTEWPRIREIGEDDFLMTMHGTFWRFPPGFSSGNTAGIAPRSNYLKVVGDFARWGDHVVLGCDDTAKSEFLNKRKAKGRIAAPQSHSNFWFVKPEQFDTFGPAIGRGAVWINEPATPDRPSDPYLFAGYDHRYLHLSHDSPRPVRLRLFTDDAGNGDWKVRFETMLAPQSHTGLDLGKIEPAAWIRVSLSEPCTASAVFSYRNKDPRPTTPDPIFDGLAGPGDEAFTGGLIRSRDKNMRTLSFAARDAEGDLGYYELDRALNLRPVDDPAAHAFTKKNTGIPRDILQMDGASILYVDDDGNRWRLPPGDPALGLDEPFGGARVAREVATERDLFNAHGTIYELPARNAGGFAKVRAVATHNRQIHDFCSYRGLLIMSGVRLDAPKDNPHLIHSTDGRTALWAGAVDDLWKLGKPVGTGGPWMDSEVTTKVPSDPYLMTGYDRKSLTLTSGRDTTVHVEIDTTGAGTWERCLSISLEADTPHRHRFPDAFQAYWIRFVADHDTTGTALLTYE